MPAEQKHGDVVVPLEEIKLLLDTRQFNNRHMTCVRHPGLKRCQIGKSFSFHGAQIKGLTDFLKTMNAVSPSSGILEKMKSMTHRPQAPSP